jgi:Ca2+/H+ antiporter, TMEM165/GDT1 family
LALAAAGAGAAVVVVAVVGAIVSRQLAGVPENALKMAVGLMLVSFGTFWAGEGVGVHWPGSELALPVLVAVYGAVAWVTVSVVGRDRRAGVEVA